MLTNCFEYTSTVHVIITMYVHVCMCLNSIHCHSFRFDYLVPGTATHSVEYENKLYCCESEDKLTKFLRYMCIYTYIRVSYRILSLGGGGDVIHHH